MENMNMRAKNFAVNEYVTSDEIKKIRKKLHLTQKEFAQLVGSSKPTIERWEKENAQIRGSIVLLIEMLNHDMDYVVSLKIPPKKLQIRQSSKGNQLKWENKGVWYKADYTGYEGLSEYLISNLLCRSTLHEAEFVRYEPEQIRYRQKIYEGVKSENFSFLRI
jgi:DNA-binding transcriptional regulator YiaG